MTVGYWGGSGAFNAVTGALERHLTGWLAVGAALTALAAASDFLRRQSSAR